MKNSLAILQILKTGHTISWESLKKNVQPFFTSEKRLSVLQDLHKIGQLEKIASHPKFSLSNLDDILCSLELAHEFYQDLGGLEGYFKTLTELLKQKQIVPEIKNYHPPSFIDVSEPREEILSYVDDGISHLHLVAEMFALGGAADRLLLRNEKTQEQLPAAKLNFAGKTLLRRLIEDIQAREYLYFQKTQKQIITPIAIMTSLEKNNHYHILEMLDECAWFGRPKESFKIFIQPLVPVIDEHGNFLLSSDCEMVLKPGGHGVLWKLAMQNGVFSWLKSLQKTKILVRQINNPLAGLDYGLLAFLGIGCKYDKKFGFASCPRLLNSAEGVNVLVQSNALGKNSMVLTNIEYCDFGKFGIEDLPLKADEPYSKFSSNTNVLFADIEAIEQAVKQKPFPGLLFNLKPGVFQDKSGKNQAAVMGRLESTMQNIADVFVEDFSPNLQTFQTFITYNKRHKTISTTKRAFDPKGPFLETPQACFYDLMTAAREILENFCYFKLPKRYSTSEYLQFGPEIVFLYHPSLGPIFKQIGKKIQGGSLALGSSLILEISDAHIVNLALDGSLMIKADQIIGQNDLTQHLNFSSNIGRVHLHNVQIKNACKSHSAQVWCGDFKLQEGMEIHLKGNSKFIAENVSFNGPVKFVVEDGICCVVFERNGEIIVQNNLMK